MPVVNDAVRRAMAFKQEQMKFLKEHQMKKLLPKTTQRFFDYAQMQGDSLMLDGDGVISESIRKQRMSKLSK